MGDQRPISRTIAPSPPPPPDNTTVIEILSRLGFALLLSVGLALLLAWGWDHSDPPAVPVAATADNAQVEMTN